MSVLISIIFLVFPALAIYACLKWPVLNKVGIVIFCYLAGIAVGNLSIFPDNLGQLKDTFSGLTVMLALPLLLFSMNIRSWFSDLAGRALLSMALAMVSVTLVSASLTYYYQDSLPNAWQMAAMATSVYTGGTPNLAAIQAALKVDNDSYIMFHTYDTLFSFLFIIFVVSIGQRFFNLYLPRFEAVTKDDGIVHESDSENVEHYKELYRPGVRGPVALAGLLSVLLFALSYGISILLPESIQTAGVILLITTFGILASLNKRIQKIPNTFQLGMYFIYVFCVAVGSMTDLQKLMQINYSFLTYVSVSIFGTMLIHSILCKIFKVDTDTFLITSTAAICSPPFVPVVAGALQNPRVLLSGLTTGIIGYAAGNYLGISIGLLFKSLLS